MRAFLARLIAKLLRTVILALAFAPRVAYLPPLRGCFAKLLHEQLNWILARGVAAIAR